MSKQTAVEWLVDMLKQQGLLIGEPDNLITVKEAKEMEKDQICWAYFNGQHKDKKEIPSKYYYETYNK